MVKRVIFCLLCAVASAGCLQDAGAVSEETGVNGESHALAPVENSPGAEVQGRGNGVDGELLGPQRCGNCDPEVQCCFYNKCTGCFVQPTVVNSCQGPGCV